MYDPVISFPPVMTVTLNSFLCRHAGNSLKATLKPHSNGDWYIGHWWMGCYIWYSEEGPGRTAAPPNFLLTEPNVTAHSSTASIPTS